MIALWLALWMGFAPAAQAAAPDANVDVAAAKALYASGSYEEALAKLAGPVAPEAADEADQYRALCLLALGRTSETERALQALITRRPLFKMSEAEVSPRLVTMFRTLRRRLLPDAARALYVKAKRSFDQKEFTAAAADLKTLQQLLADDDMDRAAPAISDLQLLADGFLRLAEAEVAAARTAPPKPLPAPTPSSPPVAAAAATPAPTTAPPARVGPGIYSIDDADVTPPVDVSRSLPAWRPPTAILGSREHRGILRIVINEQGRVETASLVRPITPAYDPLLLMAARQWQFRPAIKDGTPVKYSKDIPIVLSPMAR